MKCKSVLEEKNKIVINNMIADVVLSLQSGFENRGMVIPYFFRTNYYDCCIKIGNDLVPQRVNYKNKIIELKYIPVLIFKQVDCLIGEDSIIDVAVLKKEMDVMKENRIDFESFLFISSNACFRCNDSIFFMKNFDSNKLFNLFGFLPNIISMKEFSEKYTRPLLEGSGGFNNIDGSEYNIFENKEVTQSTLILSKFAYKNLGNIIGVMNIYDSFKNYSSDSNNVLYNYLYEKTNLNTQLIYFDILLNYGWIDLEKIANAIKISGATIACVLGINILVDIDMIIIKTNDKETIFHNSSDFINRVKDYIRKYLKQTMQLNEIMFF